MIVAIGIPSFTISNFLLSGVASPFVTDFAWSRCSGKRQAMATTAKQTFFIGNIHTTRKSIPLKNNFT